MNVYGMNGQIVQIKSRMFEIIFTFRKVNIYKSCIIENYKNTYYIFSHIFVYFSEGGWSGIEINQEHILL